VPRPGQSRHRTAGELGRHRRAADSSDQFRASERWLISCWHRRAGDEALTPRAPLDHAELLDTVARRWRKHGSNAGDLAVHVLYELAATYIAAMTR